MSGRDGKPAKIVFLQTSPGSGRALRCRNSAASRSFGNVVRLFQTTTTDAQLELLFSVLFLWVQDGPLHSATEQKLAADLIPIYEKADWSVLEAGAPIYFSTETDSIIVDSEAYSIRDRLVPAAKQQAPTAAPHQLPIRFEPKPPPYEPPFAVAKPSSSFRSSPSPPSPSSAVLNATAPLFAPGQPLKSRLI